MKGILLVDKPAGISSFDVIRKLRKIASTRKMGHTGTLDPFATGLLPICVGKATKVASKISGKDKSYLAKIILGEKSETGDSEGKIIQKKEIPEFNSEKLNNIKSEILELKEQIPPKYSAIKINGVPAYKLARAGKEFELKPRKINILDLKFISFTEKSITYEIKVSKGTYIREISETIAKKLGTCGYTIELKRLTIEKLSIKNAVKLEDLTPENWTDFLIPIPKILIDFPKTTLNELEISEASFGRRFSRKLDDIDEIMMVDKNDKLIGFGKISDNYIYPKKIFL